MPKRQLLAHLKGDLAGGAISAVLTIPVSMGYGVLALSPLGDQYVSYGILAGLFSAIFLPLTALVLGDRTGLMYAPRSVVTFLITSVVAQILVRLPADVASGRVLGVAFAVVLFGGAFQTLFGILRIGNIIRYIPSPVMAGFQNAVAVLIFLSQLGTLLGLPRGVSPLQVIEHPSVVRAPTAVVGVLTCLAIWGIPRLTKRIPPVVVGFVVGVGTYYLLSVVGYRAGLGPVIGAMPHAALLPKYLGEFSGLLIDPTLRPVVPTMILGALSLAIIGSLDGLLCAKTVESAGGARVEGNRVLASLGSGNMVAACFGGIAGGLNLGSTFANMKAGGRTWVSAAVSLVLLVLAVVMLGPVIAFIPRVVIAGILVVVAVQLLDRWSLQLLRRFLSGDFVYWKVMALDLLVVALVATVTIVYNLIVGVALGLSVAVIFFLLRMSKSVIRRAYRADVVRSRRTRDPRLMELLTRDGRRIVVFELEGPIFFGTAEDLASHVDATLRDGARYVVFDLKRVNELDSTGARVIEQLRAKLTRAGSRLLLSHARDNPLIWNVLTDMSVATAIGADGLFADTDAALEWSEDQVILAARGEAALSDEVPVERLSVLTGLIAVERELVARVLSRRTYQTGDVVIREGDDDRRLFMISKGTASVKVRITGQEREKRLASFSPGAVFGEVALLDEEPRSATVTADGELVCYVLDEEHFKALTGEHPTIAIRLLMNLSRELSRRLRKANAMISQLEE